MWYFFFVFVFFFKQKTAYEMRISDWSSDVCSSDLRALPDHILGPVETQHPRRRRVDPLISPLAVLEHDAIGAVLHQVAEQGALMPQVDIELVILRGTVDHDAQGVGVPRLRDVAEYLAFVERPHRKSVVSGTRG